MTKEDKILEIILKGQSYSISNGLTTIEVAKEISALFENMYAEETVKTVKELHKHYMGYIDYLLNHTNYPLIFGKINKENTEKHYQFWCNLPENKK
jgi:hypothetical protein